jgi:transcriptional regulator with XRE-family HTH domain
MTRRHREPTALGRRLLQLRQRHSLTQARLARAAGLSAAVVASVEQGQRADPRFSTVIKLARALGVSVDDLVPEG